MSQVRLLDYNYLFEEAVTLTASSEDSNFPVSNLTHSFRSKVWRTTGVTSENVVIDLGSTEEIDSFALLIDPMGGLKFTTGATIKLQANATDSWSSPSVDVTLSIDLTYDVITHFFTTAQSYRYWRVTFADAGNALGYLEIPKILLCKATQLSQTPEIGFIYSVKDPSRIVKTPYGHRYVDTYPNLRGFEFNYVALPDSDIETLYGIYERLGMSRPLAISIDSTATLWDKDRFFLYGYFTGDFKATQLFYTYFNLPLAIEEGA